MAKSTSSFILGIIISIIDLYINYNAKDFPEFHEARVKFNEYSLLSPLLFILMIITILCGICCVLICFICCIIISIYCFYYAIISFYLYFSYDGWNRINNPLIHIFLWISFLSYVINLFTICFVIYISKNGKNSSKDSALENNYDLLI